MMKTRFLIIIGIVFVFSIVGVFVLNYYIDEEVKAQKFNDEQIDRIFKRCDYQKKMNDRDWIGLDGNKITDHQPKMTWNNSTHYIDNNICEWITIEKYESDASLKDAMERCWIGNSEFLDDDFVLWNNETHYIDTDTCLITETITESDVTEYDTSSENKKPYTLYNISGVKQIYKIGEQISFTETIQGYANPCVSPHYEIIDGNTLETVWQYKIVYPCPFIKDPQQFKTTNTIPNDNIPSPIINQTGQYILRSHYSYSDGYKDVTFSVVDESIGEKENES